MSHHIGFGHWIGKLIQDLNAARKGRTMFRSDRALDVAASSQANALADRFTFARAGPNEGTVYMHTRESTLADFITEICKILLALAVLGLVAIGGVFALNALDPLAEARPAVGVAANDQQNRELDQLRSEVALLTEQSLALRSELALLTGQGGVLPKLVARLQEQRKVNGVHSNAIRQLYSTTSQIGASLPLVEEGAASESIGSRPVKVTPVAAPNDDAPKHVVLIPEGEIEAQPNTEGGVSE